ncbi:MAG: alpha/beta hydrolase [Acidobacteria bacterium]|nr:alpha/beta hydrolase [Acidobacteriota bacterium]
MRLVLALLCCVASFAGIEVGSINGAQFRIDVPENWNGSLVIYCHGYSPVPSTFKETPPNPLMKVFLDRGFALAQSGYAAGGWAIAEAAVDTESLRRYFTTKYKAPVDTWITGHSMGGFLTMMLMETYPTVYKGGLPLCAPLAAPSWFMGRGAFDGKVVFEYLFPGVVTAELASSQVTPAIMKALEADPAKSAVVRRMNGFKTNRDAAGVIAFAYGILAELTKRTGGNPFDNRNTIYSGSDDDRALNAGVKRYEADPKAAAYLRTYYTPTGKIAQPMLAIHTDYDPLVAVWMPNMYQMTVEQAGTAGKFVQQYVKRDGHCSISPAETAKGFDELREWVEKGVRPSPGDRTIAAK